VFSEYPSLSRSACSARHERPSASSWYTAYRLRPIHLQIGVIAGTRNIEPWFAGYFHSPNDGDVSVDSSKLQEMTDFVTVNTSHSFLIYSSEVQSQTEAFLAQGHFTHH